MTKYITQYQYDYIEKYKEYFGEIFYDIAKNKRPNNDTKIKDIMAEMGKLENDLGEELQKIEDTIKRKPPFKDNVVFSNKNELNDKERFFLTRDEMIKEFASSGITNEVNKNLEKIKKDRILKNKNLNN